MTSSAGASNLSILDCIGAIFAVGAGVQASIARASIASGSSGNAGVTESVELIIAKTHDECAIRQQGAHSLAIGYIARASNYIIAQQCILGISQKEYGIKRSRSWNNVGAISPCNCIKINGGSHERRLLIK